MIDVLSVACPNCQTPAGEQCTAPDDYSRHPIKRVHAARLTAAFDADYLEPVADMSEAFQRDAEVEAVHDRLMAELSELGFDLDAVARARIFDALEEASKPF